MATAQSPESQLPRSVRPATVVLLVLLALACGLALRGWCWQATAPCRMVADPQNAFRWGRATLDTGFFALYDQVVAEHGKGGQYELDYSPLRLLVASTWVRWLDHWEPGIAAWRNELAVTWPMLALNLLAELTAALGVVLLVRRWTGRYGRAARLAALLMWLSPAAIVNGYGWPQWDLWLVPFYVWAALVASRDRWFGSGALVAIGSMLKGQLLLVSPLFLLWPLLAGRPTAALRWLLGLVAAVGAVTAPWLVRTGPAAAAYLAAAALGGLLAAGPAVWRGRWEPTRLAAGALTGGALAALALGPHLGGSLAWLEVGFGFGTRHYPHMVVGPAYNLAGLLAVAWEVGLHDPVSRFAPGWLDVRAALLAAYLALLALAAAATAAGERRRDPRTLLALVAPWVFMFALLPQMHERYLLWGAVLSATWVALGTVPTLLHALLTVTVTAGMSGVLLWQNRALAPRALHLLELTWPSGSWVVLAATAVLASLLIRMLRTPPASTRTEVHSRRGRSV